MIIFELILNWALFCFFEAARVVLKIGSSLKSNYHKEIQLALTRETLCSFESVGILAYPSPCQIWALF